MLPDLISLRCFVEAARATTFREAARAVALTPAALGQRIRMLEEDLGAPLFRRTSRSVALTLEGLRLLPVAEATLASARECGPAARGTAPPAIELTLGTRHELGLSWIVPMLDALEASLPNVALHLYFGAASDLIVRLRTAEIDCAVSSMRTNDPKIDAVDIHREDYALVAAPSLLRRQPLRRAADAPSHVLLDATHEMPLMQYLRDALPAGAARFGRLVRLGTIAAIRARVLAGKGVAVLPLYFVDEDLRRRRLVRCLPRVRMAHDHFRLQFRANDPRRPVFEALARAMKATPLS